LSVLAVIVLGVALGVVALLARAKHRQIWREIFGVRREVAALRRELITARKEIVLAGIREESHLPLMMPSQNGEDLLLWEFFGARTNGFYVEVGAYDGVGFSNSYFFEAVGWRGVLVEAVPESYRAAVTARPNSRVVHAAAGSRKGSIRVTVVEGGGGVGTLSSATPDLSRIRREGGRTREVEVPLVPLTDLLVDVNEPIDFVSIDVEGYELAVLEGFDVDRFAPRVLVIEDNSNGVDGRVAERLAKHGYVERCRLEQNAFYTHRDDARAMGWPR